MQLSSLEYCYVHTRDTGDFRVWSPCRRQGFHQYWILPIDIEYWILNVQYWWTGSEDKWMNEAIKSNYEEYRPWYRPISTGSRVTTTDTEVVAAETEREKGVCLCKQETHMEDSSRTIVIPPSTPLKQKQILPKLVLNLLIYKRNTL